MEAVAYQLKAVYEELRSTVKESQVQPKIIGSGGALLGSPTLQHIVADSLGTPLYPSHEHEASARGSALLALEAMGVLPDVATVQPELMEPVQPDVRLGAIYQAAAQRQKQLYAALLGDREG